MSLSQNDLGRAFEYGIVVAMSNIIPAEIIEIVIETDRKNCPWRTKYIYQDKRNEYLCDKEITTEDTKCTKKNCPYRKGE